MSANVEITKTASVWLVQIDRSARKNAVDRETAEQLADAFREFDRDPSALVAVLHGKNSTFCAGADLKAISSGQGNRVDPEGDAPMGVSRMHLSKPVIAAISGYAVAGGLELALWCDLRVVDRSAVLGVFCRRWGVPLIDGGTVRLPRLIGIGRALDLVLTGRAVGAEEALRMGLVDRVVDDGTCLERAMELGAEIASFPQECMRADRASVYRQWDLSESEALRQEFVSGISAVAAEGLAGAREFSNGSGRHGSKR